MKTIVVCREKKQVLDPTLFVVENGNAPWPAIYNAVINKNFGEAVGFIENWTMTSETTAAIIEVFTKYPELVGAVYADTNEKTYTSFSRLTNPLGFNPPVFINRKLVNERFDVNLRGGSTHDFLRKISQKYLVYHIPKQLFVR